MSQSTTTPNRERLHTLNNVSETHKENYPLIEKNEIPNTPFIMVKQNEKYFVVVGNYQLTEPKNTEEEALQMLETHKWHIIITLQMIAHKKLTEFNPLMTMPEVRANTETPYETESL